MIKLIVTDLDGTFMQDHVTIHPDNITAVRRAQAKGVQFAVASGRSAAACSMLLRDSGLEDTFIIGTNGCQMMDRPYGKMLAVYPIDENAVKAALRVFQRHNLGGCLYTENAIFYNEPAMLNRANGSVDMQTYFERMASAGMRVEAGWDALEATLRVERPLKAFCSYKPGQEAAFAEAREACAAIEGVTLTSSWHDNFEVMPVNVDKGRAVRELAQRLGIAQSEVLAFGDSDNDLPMLTWAGHAYAMANANDNVKRATNKQTGYSHEGGVARTIDALLG